MTALEELVTSLLYEGYALYPYTPGTAKNATPTPFGIVYPPAYAGGSAATHDRIELECELVDEAPVSASVRFLQATGERHEAVERTIELDAPGSRDFDFDGLRGRVTLETSGRRVRLVVENTTDAPAGLARGEALLRSLLSTHPLVRARDGRFVSPLEAGCTSVNTYPVLATPADDVVLGAAIVLPDHPQLAPQSRGSLFDATEIEEALLLHVQALSDSEREAIAAGDPAVAATIERAAAATPEDLLRLHGVMQPVEEEIPGERETLVGGVTVRLGAKLILRPKPGADAHDFLLEGRTATLERIYVDYDDAVHLAVTVDSDPMQEVLRESGRFLFFKTDEVEVVG
jgi:hypothetical protein